MCGQTKLADASKGWEISKDSQIIHNNFQDFLTGTPAVCSMHA